MKNDSFPKNSLPTSCIPVAKIEDDGYDWDERHAKILSQVARNRYDLVFIGDSITHFWEGASGADHGSAVWKKYYGRRNVLNLGYGYDRTQNVLWRLANGELAGQSPKLIITNIGTNQFSQTIRHPLDTPEDAAAGIVAVSGKLRQMFPEAHLVFMSIFPRGGQLAPLYKELIPETNRLVKEALSGTANVEIVDLTKEFLLPDGSICRDYYQPDMTHLSCQGYELWAGAIEEIIRKCLHESTD